METNTTKPTLVKSYVRYKPEHVQESEYQPATGIAQMYVLVLAVILWQVTLPIVLVVGAAYGLKTILASNVRMIEPEVITALPEVPHVKRAYRKHTVPVVNHYQLGKVKI